VKLWLQVWLATDCGKDQSLSQGIAMVVASITGRCSTGTRCSAVIGEPHLDPGAVASLSQSATAAGRRPHPWSDMPDGCITRRPLGERRAEPVSIGGSFVFTGELKRHRPLSVVGCHMRNDLERWGEIDGTPVGSPLAMRVWIG
jgi:hypothetical protein